MIRCELEHRTNHKAVSLILWYVVAISIEDLELFADETANNTPAKLASNMS